MEEEKIFASSHFGKYVGSPRFEGLRLSYQNRYI